MLNFAIGPVMMEQDILDIGSQQIPYFRTKEFSTLLIETESLLVDIVKAPLDSRVLFLTGSGTAAMEAAVINLFTEEDNVLVVNGGSFGTRFKDLCQIHRLRFTEVKLDYFEPLKAEHLSRYDGLNYTALMVNVHETSTGVLYDMELIRDFCKRNGLFLVVDAISSFLADPYNMDQYGANVTILASQKALALPPGMSYLVVDGVAQDRIARNNARSLYFDLKGYLTDGVRGQTPFTPAVSNLIQLNRRLEYVKLVSVEKVVAQVASQALDFRNRIRGLPLKIASPSPSNALTPLRPICRMSAIEIFEYLKDKNAIFVAPNGGCLSSCIFRVGHIGALTIEDNKRLIGALHQMSEAGILS